MEKSKLEIALLNAIDMLIGQCGYTLNKVCNELDMTEDDYCHMVFSTSNEKDS